MSDRAIWVAGLGKRFTDEERAAAGADACQVGGPLSGWERTPCRHRR